MTPIRFVTVSTRRYLPEATLLARSLQKHHPGAVLVCYLVEREVRPGDRREGLMELRPVQDLALPDRAQFLFQYEPFPLCAALKPFALQDVLDRDAAERLIFLDGDMLACAPLLPAFEDAWRQAPVLLTPHLLKPWLAQDLGVHLVKGAFNVGCVAVRRGSEASSFLGWWQARLTHDCVDDVLRGLFYEQKWMDLAAASLPGVAPLRHPGVNVGHWCLAERTFESAAGGVTVDGQWPLCLLHFSGFDPVRFSRHAAGVPLPPALRPLVDDYAAQLARERDARGADGAYTFGYFDDGATIAPSMREAVRRGLIACANPFAEARRFAGLVADAAPAEPQDLVARLARAEHRLQRLWKHPVIGRVWRLWARWVNRDLRWQE